MSGMTQPESFANEQNVLTVLTGRFDVASALYKNYWIFVCECSFYRCAHTCVCVLCAQHTPYRWWQIDTFRSKKISLVLFFFLLSFLFEYYVYCAYFSGLLLKLLILVFYLSQNCFCVNQFCGSKLYSFVPDPSKRSSDDVP